MKKIFFYLPVLPCFFYFTACKKNNDNLYQPAQISISNFTPAHALEGDTVSITGNGFSASDSILFNGVLASVVSANSTQIKVVVPQNASSGSIKIVHNGYTASSASPFTVDLPVTANATVTKLADIPAYPTNGGSGVRVFYANNSLFITGPGTNQDAVYKMDLTTNAVAVFFSMPSNSLTTAIACYNGSDTSFVVVSAESVSSGNNYLYTHRYGITTNSSSNLHIICNSMKFSTSLGRFLATGFDNKIYTVNDVTYGGNSSSNDFDTLINSQLYGIPEQANATLGVGSSGSIFVFANHALWQLQPDKTLKLVAGQAGVSGTIDGQGSNALFQDGGYARGNAIAVDNNDNVYVADYGSGCIRKVDGAGNVTTVVGNPQYIGNSYTGRGDKMAFYFDSWDMVFGNDYKTLYVVSRNNSNNPQMLNSVYKVSFQ